MKLKGTIEKVTLIIGISVVAIVGLFFILFTDLYLKALSTQLFLGIFFPLVSVVFFILAESFRHSVKLFNIFKIIACVFAAGLR